MRCLHVADIEVVIGKHRAADGAHQDCAVLQAELGQRLGNQLVHDAVSAAGTVVGLLLQLRLAFELVVKRGRLLMNYFVFAHRILRH